MIDDQLRRLQRIDPVRIAAQLLHGIAHRGQIHHGRHAGEILHQDAGRAKGDFDGRFGLRVPVCQCLDVLAGNRDAVLVAQQVFEEDLERPGQARHAVVLVQDAQTEEFIDPLTDAQDTAR